MTARLLQIVQRTALSADQIAEQTRQIHAATLRRSQYIATPNFTAIHPADLERLFAEYDNRFFAGEITSALGSVPLRFAISRRMTSSGGQTVHATGKANGIEWYEIHVSQPILFGCFDGEDHRPVTASGIVCGDRLEALQRVMEHELVHLVELLLWKRSSCRKPRFHSITWRLFGHTEHRHQLITPKEQAIVKYGIQPGMTVRFRLNGVEHTGIVNRIRKRATVLVEDYHGERYSDGKRYRKFYVPVPLLQATE